MKVLITGVPGTGKTTMSKMLRQRGFIAVDFSDIKGMCSWRDMVTKEKVQYSPVQIEDWFKDKEYVCDIEQLKEVMGQHEDIIITGVASGNITDVLPLFDKVLLLQCSPETLVSRLQTRVPIYGKTKAEQDDAVVWQERFIPKLLAYGAISINTEGSLDAVVDKIIAQI